LLGDANTGAAIRVVKGWAKVGGVFVRSARAGRGGDHGLITGAGDIDGVLGDLRSVALNLEIEIMSERARDALLQRELGGGGDRRGFLCGKANTGEATGGNQGGQKEAAEVHEAKET